MSMRRHGNGARWIGAAALLAACAAAACADLPGLVAVKQARGVPEWQPPQYDSLKLWLKMEPGETMVQNAISPSSVTLTAEWNSKTPIFLTDRYAVRMAGDSSIVVSPRLAANINAAFTVAGWIRINNTGNFAAVFAVRDSGNRLTALVGHSGAHLVLASETVTSFSGVTLSTWHHFAYVKPAGTGTVLFYRNGGYVGSRTSVDYWSSQSVWRWNRDTFGFQFTGGTDLKHAMYWTVALSAAEIADLHANTGQTVAAPAPQIVEDANYVWHVYRYSGSITLDQETTLSALIVAGGGTGGTIGYCGGGGAGGMIETNLVVAAGTYAVVVAPPTGAYAHSGGASSCFGVSATGGGRGSGTDMAAQNGGSGGGGRYLGGSFAPGTGIAGQGHGGGNGTQHLGWTGGGGGAAAVGFSTSSTPVAPGGGAGKQSTVCPWGNYYAGGGGGGGVSSYSTGGPGGIGGGGAGGNTSGRRQGTAGSANTGGGGGGGSDAGPGGQGGSGIVIIRIAK